MPIEKLKIESFNKIKVVNFDKYDLGISSTEEDFEVIIYYIDKLGDIESAIKLAVESNLPKENRVIFVHEKGRKDGINRNAIFEPFRNNDSFGYETTKIFKLKAPNYCALSDKLSAAVLTLVK